MIDITVDISKSEIAETANIYRYARVKESLLKGHNVVGDLSRVDYSELDDYVRIDRLNQIYCARIGRHSYTGAYTVIMHAEVGNFCSISWGVTIGGANHDYTKLSTHAFLYNDYDKLRPENEPVPYDRFAEACVIGNDVWIAANACICRGVKVGDGAVIGTGAVVTKDVPPYAIVVGNPARVLKYRFTEEKIEELLKLQWWNWSDEKIKENYELFR